MATQHTTSHTKVGDWVETRGIHGEPPRRGQIVELLGREGHPHYRVRWDEQHESILYPADGVIITPGSSQRSRRAVRPTRDAPRPKST